MQTSIAQCAVQCTYVHTYVTYVAGSRVRPVSGHVSPALDTKHRIHATAWAALLRALLMGGEVLVGWDYPFSHNTACVTARQSQSCRYPVLVPPALAPRVTFGQTTVANLFSVTLGV